MKIKKKVDIEIDIDGIFCSSRCLHHSLDLYCTVFKSELSKKEDRRFIKTCRCQKCIDTFGGW